MKDLHTVESVNVFQLQTQQAMQKKAKEKETQRSSNHPGAASRKAKGRTRRKGGPLMRTFIHMGLLLAIVVPVRTGPSAGSRMEGAGGARAS